MSDINHTRDCILPSDGKAEGLVKASELFALAAERDTLRAENEKLRTALDKICNGQRDADLDYLDLFVEVKMEARAALGEKQ